MSLIILSKSPIANFFSKEIYKIALRRMANITRGPDAVLLSLIRGLDELKQPYLYNPKQQEIRPEDTVFVNGSVNALRWAIKEKKEGRIKKLVSGPNMVVGPNDFNGIINSPEIDLILQPSNWVRDFYLSINPRLSDKIKVWPSGVFVPEITKEVVRDIVLVYFKNCAVAGLFEGILNTLEKKSIKFVVIKYGSFKQEDYYELLEHAMFMIYISKSESQGVALQEAWVREVPTLVWNSGEFGFRNFRWSDPRVGAPYLNEQNGLFFRDIAEFKIKLIDFVEKRVNFSARNYVKENLSDYRCAKNFINLIV